MKLQLETGTTIEIYLLENWDGGGGMYNSTNGMITTYKSVADEWKRKNVGASYRTVTGTIINDFTEIEVYELAEKRRKALAKLTENERKILGLE